MSSSSNTKSLFKDQSHLYSLYRPSYDKVLYGHIMDYIKNNSKLKRSVALDVATGNGQAAFDLRTYFDKVIAMDIQESQIKQAFKGFDNIQFIEGSAENICLDANSIDLVCVAQALHWFDTVKFYKEAHRVMKDTGTLALWGYDLCHITSKKSEYKNNAERASKVVLELYKNSELAKYWDNRRFLIDNHYVTIAPNNHNDEKIWKNVTRINMTMSKQWKLDDVVKYISTWSAYNTYMREKKVDRGCSLDPCVMIEKQLLEIYGTNDAEVNITWPIFLYLATK